MANPSQIKGIFERNCPAADAAIVIVPVCWDATTSYHAGTAGGPPAVAAASHQLDFFDWQWGNFIDIGIHFDDTMIAQTQELNRPARQAAEALRRGENKEKARAEVNRLSSQLNKLVEDRCRHWLGQKKLVAVLGGDHSSPYGYIKALGDLGQTFGILHVDAHYDYRLAYEGFTHSHASIMRNLSELPAVKGFAHIGIRDYCQEEHDFAVQSKAHSWLGPAISHRLAKGETWEAMCEEIISKLPDQIYVSLDVDGLDPAYCPSTGTPVPGGLTYAQLNYLLETVATSGKKIVGFDLNEVSPSRDESQWDENVGARLLYKLCGMQLKSLGRI